MLLPAGNCNSDNEENSFKWNSQLYSSEQAFLTIWKITKKKFHFLVGRKSLKSEVDENNDVVVQFRWDSQLQPVGKIKRKNKPVQLLQFIAAHNTNVVSFQTLLDDPIKANFRGCKRLLTKREYRMKLQQDIVHKASLMLTDVIASELSHLWRECHTLFANGELFYLLHQEADSCCYTNCNSSSSDNNSDNTSLSWEIPYVVSCEYAIPMTASTISCNNDDDGSINGTVINMNINGSNNSTTTTTTISQESKRSDDVYKSMNEISREKKYKLFATTSKRIWTISEDTVVVVADDGTDGSTADAALNITTIDTALRWAFNNNFMNKIGEKLQFYTEDVVTVVIDFTDRIVTVICSLNYDNDNTTTVVSTADHHNSTTTTTTNNNCIKLKKQFSFPSYLLKQTNSNIQGCLHFSLIEEEDILSTDSADVSAVSSTTTSTAAAAADALLLITKRRVRLCNHYIYYFNFTTIFNILTLYYYYKHRHIKRFFFTIYIFYA